MSASRTERLLALALVLLNTRRPLTRSELRKAVLDYPPDADQASFERMFERDKDELRLMGLPIEAVPVDGAEGLGYLIPVGQTFLPDIVVTEEERLVLAIAAHVWRDANWRHAATNAVRKLELVGEFEEAAHTQYRLSFPVDPALLTTILTAAQRRTAITFDYARGNGSPLARRLVQPWAAVAAHGRWYLVGFDVDRGARRTFRLSRIVGAVRLATDQTFATPQLDDADLRIDIQDEPSDVVVVSCRITPGRAPTLRARAGVSAQVEHVTVEFDSVRHAVCEILRAGDAVTVDGPSEVIDEIRNALTTLCSPVTRDVSDATADLQRLLKKQERGSTETSATQLGRLLAIIPWLRAHPGVTYSQAAQKFGTDETKLRRDLELAVCTEFGQNMLTMDIDAWGESIYVRDSQGINAPLRLTHSEASSLLVGLHVMLQTLPATDTAAVASVIEKLAVAVDTDSPLEHLRVVGERSSTDVEEQIVAAIRGGYALDIDYISAVDSATTRTVDPIVIIDTQQHRYLHAWCRSAAEIRQFRLDRIQQIRTTDLQLEIPPAIDVADAVVDPVGEVVALLIEPTARWWTETVPTLGSVELSDGAALVAVRVADPKWIVGAALSLGGAAAIVSPVELDEHLRAVAGAALAQYLK